MLIKYGRVMKDVLGAVNARIKILVYIVVFHILSHVCCISRDRAGKL